VNGSCFYLVRIIVLRIAVAFTKKEYILLEMKEILEEAINEFVENSKQVNLDSEASRKALAEFIESYLLEEESEECCGNDCGCH